MLLCIKQVIDSGQDSNRVGVESEFFNISALPEPGSLQERLVVNPVYYEISQARLGEADFASAVVDEADLTGLGSSTGETTV